MSGPYRVVDLFAGCGGLTSGFVQTGSFEPVAAVEMDRDAAATYAQNFGEHVTSVTSPTGYEDHDLRGRSRRRASVPGILAARQP